MALTPQQVEHYRLLLTASRDELARGTVRAESEVSEQGYNGPADPEPADSVDRATAGYAKDELLQEAGRQSEQLAQVEDALRAIADGSYGVCRQCGQEIPVSRLDAVPWATLCVTDQEFADRRRRAALARESAAMTGGAPSRVVA
jgi:DnaK suppressor protein